MGNDASLVTFDYLNEFVKFEDAERPLVELAVKAGSRYLSQFVARNLVLAPYTEIYDLKDAVTLNNHHIVSIGSILYDAYRKWEDPTEITDYFWHYPSRDIEFPQTRIHGNVNPVIRYGIRRKSLQISYLAGKYRLDWYGEDEPTEPTVGDVWQKKDGTLLRRIAENEESLTYPAWKETYYLEGDKVTSDGDVYKCIETHTAHPNTPEKRKPPTGEAWEDYWEIVVNPNNKWVEIDEKDVIDQIYVNALIEVVLYNKSRILTNSVGVRTRTGTSSHTYSNQGLEISIPENIQELLTGERYLI